MQDADVGTLITNELNTDHSDILDVLMKDKNLAALLF